MPTSTAPHPLDGRVHSRTSVVIWKTVTVGRATVVDVIDGLLQLGEYMSRLYALWSAGIICG